MTIQTRVALAGGLGNQLFQYAYSISQLDENGYSSLECVGFKVGAADEQMPDIANFDLPRSVIHRNNWSKNKLQQFCFNYLLRNSSYHRILRIGDPLAIFARLVVSLFTFINFKNEENSVQSLKYNRFANLEIGYFQDAYLSGNVISTMQEISLSKPSEHLDIHTKLAEKENPLIVHIRLGDYAQNPKFGILSRGYYRKVIQEVFNLTRYGKIWLFSDDIPLALDFLGAELLPFTRVIDSNMSTCETFEIMRLGSGYVIGNSSFSLWAAILRKNQNALVYAPSPWFRSARYSERMFPSSWSFRDADFHSY